MARSTLRAPRGFTLVETVMAIVVAGLLMGIATPRFIEYRRSFRLDSAAYQLAGDLRRAQVEAIKRNQTVQLARIGASTYNIQSVPPAPATVYYARSFEPQATFDAGSAMSVSMASFGPPVGGGAAFIVDVGGAQKTVTVSAAGLVSVQ